jgi:2-phospho-L-lactate guanylyltransferase (CobY/MobA/RfbA family)
VAIPVAALVPLRDPATGKSRLRLGDPSLDVELLIVTLATGVLKACAPLPTFLVGSGTRLADIAKDAGVLFLDIATGSLNGDLEEARRQVHADLTVVALGDIRHPTGIGAFSFPAECVTLVTDHHGTGTSVVAAPGTTFAYAFGANSAGAHRAEAQRRGLNVVELADSPWRADLDSIEDL